MNWKSAIKHLVFIRNKPLVIFGMAKGFFKAIVLRQNVLRTVDLAVTYNCHYKCEYCSAFLLKKEGKEGAGSITIRFSGDEEIINFINAIEKTNL